MKKSTIITLTILFCSCNANFVYIEKHIYIKDGKEHQILMQGSSLEDVLKGNSQKADGKLELNQNKAEGK